MPSGVVGSSFGEVRVSSDAGVYLRMLSVWRPCDRRVSLRDFGGWSAARRDSRRRFGLSERRRMGGVPGWEMERTLSEGMFPGGPRPLVAGV